MVALALLIRLEVREQVYTLHMLYREPHKGENNRLCDTQIPGV